MAIYNDLSKIIITLIFAVLIILFFMRTSTKKKYALIVDSNILMDPSLEPAIRAAMRFCMVNKAKIHMLSDQFDELRNIKKNKQKNIQGAMLALERISLIQDAGFLFYEKAEHKPNENAYADPKILEMIVLLLNMEFIVVFVTNDVELGILAREKSKNVSNVGVSMVMNSKEFIEIWGA